MKILCLQLARFGDIYQTWPVLRALRRKHSCAEIDLVVRSRFASAVEGLDAVDQLIVLPTQEWLSGSVSEAITKTQDWLARHNWTQYDRVINFSFSPASSYLTDLTGCSNVAGYSRQSDGFLAIPDEASSYFYAQVGVERSNRIHLTDLFAMIAQTELMDEDFRSPKGIEPQARSGIAVQIGASQKQKNLSTSQWLKFIRNLVERTDEPICIVGALSDLDSDFTAGIEKLTKDFPNKTIQNLVGQTKLFDLFQIFADSKLFIGCDSVGLHIATLTKTPTLNISFASVRFWETGPRATGSRIIWYEFNSDCDVERIVQEALCMLDKTYSKWPIVLKDERRGVIYDLVGYEENDFAWQLIRAIYAGTDWPRTSSKFNNLAFERLTEVSKLGLQQIEILESQGPQSLPAEILNHVDAMIAQIAELAPDVSPLVRWFQAEKSRIAPGRFEDILASTKSLFSQLLEFCRAYRVNFEMLNDKECQWKS